MRFFSYDSKLSQFMCKAADCVWLCLLWLISSLPVVTAGAATSAAIFTMDKTVKREEGKLWNTYWRAFKGEFSKTLALWGMILAMLVMLLLDFSYTYQMVLADITPNPWLTYGLAIVAGIFLFWAQYWFPYQARFQDSVKTILKNTLYIALMNLIPSVILLALLAVIFILVAAGFTSAPFISIILLTAYFYAADGWYSRILNKYIPAEEPQIISP